MPLVWRGMRMAEGQPEVARGKNALGVLVGDAPTDDIPEEDGRHVRLADGGCPAVPPHPEEVEGQASSPVSEGSGIEQAALLVFRRGSVRGRAACSWAGSPA